MSGHKVTMWTMVLSAIAAARVDAKQLLAVTAGHLRATARRARKGVTLLADPWTAFKVARALSPRKLRPVMGAAPRLMFKYVSNYLQTGFSRQERASILVRHYTVLRSHAPEQFFHAIVREGLELWRESLGDHTYSIFLTFPRAYHSEGDLALIFRADAMGIYTLSFTIGPGSIAGLDAKDVMYVGRVQGKGRGLDLIRTATKDCLDISPAALLLSAAQGIALDLKLERIIGVSAHAQIAAERALPHSLVTAYDEFWITLGGQRLNRDMYQLTVPLAEKPLHSIRRSHRSRVRRKRAFKKFVSEHVRAKFHESIVGEAAEVGLARAI